MKTPSVTASLYSFRTKAARVAAFCKAHKRAIILFLLLAWAALPLIFEQSLDLLSLGINLVFIASQLFWFRRVRELGQRLIASGAWRLGLATAGLIAYFFLLLFNFITWWGASRGSALTLRAALLEAPFRWWLFGSLLGFLLVTFFWITSRMTRTVSWAYRQVRGSRKPDLRSLERRRFLQQTAYTVGATPFVAGAYGLLYGRIDLEITHQRVRLARLSKAFENFRLVQLSDLHISAFMSAEQIRRYAAIANQLKPDLVALTGDFVTWDATAQDAVVEALSVLKAPFGVFGCLGNHEWMAGNEDSITRLFAAQGTRILRNERVVIESAGSTLNLLGVDYQSLDGRAEAPGHPVKKYLPGVERLLLPDTVNILLSHNPNTFDRAAELGIDLSLSGHTHGGQIALEFMHSTLATTRIITPYIRGWFQKGDAQLYVNRGIGTITFPIRLGARPEITVFELTRT
jgi:predicted MPP superfamily phosphohydrolase